MLSSAIALSTAIAKMCCFSNNPSESFLSRDLICAVVSIINTDDSINILLCKEKHNLRNNTAEVQDIFAEILKMFVMKKLENELRLINQIDLRKGDRVRILVGPFKGVEGTYIRQEKRVIIKIEGISGSATMELNASDIEKKE